MDTNTNTVMDNATVATATVETPVVNTPVNTPVKTGKSKSKSKSKNGKGKSTKTPAKTPAKTTKSGNGPGRPRYIPSLPTKKNWTFADLMTANGVDKETGKGDRCSKLTLCKWLDVDMYIRDNKTNEIIRTNGSSLVIRAKNEDGTYLLAAPDNAKGLGRKQIVYTKRVQVVKTSTKPHSVNSDTSTGTSAYEAQKAALGLTPAVTITPAPAPEATPETISTETISTETIPA